jgi:hypothetical protein
MPAKGCITDKKHEIRFRNVSVIITIKNELVDNVIKFIKSNKTKNKNFVIFDLTSFYKK